MAHTHSHYSTKKRKNVKNKNTAQITVLGIIWF